MKSVLFAMTMTLLLSAAGYSQSPETDLPPVMQDIIERHPSFTVNGSSETGAVSNLYYIGAAASGVFICRIKVGSFVQCRKMLLLR